MHWETEPGTNPLPGEKANQELFPAPRHAETSSRNLCPGSGSRKQHNSSPIQQKCLNTCFKVFTWHFVLSCGAPWHGRRSLQDSSIPVPWQEWVQELQSHLPGKSCHWILTPCDKSWMEQIKDISSSTWSLRVCESSAPERSDPVHFFSLLSLETLGINGEVMKETLNRLCFPPSPGSLSQILSASVSHSNLILDFFPLFFSTSKLFHFLT